MKHIKRLFSADAVAAVDTWKFYGVIALAFLSAWYLVSWIDQFPYTLFQFWFIKWDWAEFRNIPWILLLLGPTISLFRALTSRNSWDENVEISDGFWKNMWTAVKAGIFEEVLYRWLLFYLAIFAFALDQALIDWFGSFAYIKWVLSLHVVWIIIIVIVGAIIGQICKAISAHDDFGLVARGIAFVIWIMDIILNVVVGVLITKWIYIAILFPIVNWVTLGKFSDMIFGLVWMIPAAMISTNWKFGSGHLLNGVIGGLHMSRDKGMLFTIVNVVFWGIFAVMHTWALGMLFYWFMIHFGLPVAMAIHAGFDIVITLIVSVDAEIELFRQSRRRYR